MNIGSAACLTACLQWARTMCTTSQCDLTDRQLRYTDLCLWEHIIKVPYPVLHHIKKYIVSRL